MGKGSNLVYTITYQTKAIMHKESSYYRSWILEGERERFVLHKPEKIIEHNCLIYGTTMEGRKTAVQSILKSARKLPIPVSPEKGFYMIPTTSTRKKDCVWLAYHHIKSYEQRDDKTYISFYDGTGLFVNISEFAFDMQYKRTSQVIVHLNRPVIFSRINVIPRGPSGGTS
ncbi:competence protein ComK [Virgibacillus sp. YIM 98842]|jgi:competence protein ComK|uniref:competence protein ComK n=1 Tax=Virgibacillus sp. YIM 98842 TaxID=2663533 RepID=UPI0013DD3B45|nr:competence protein ComK [Virgibacillus sp. YIM 98842]